MSELHQIRLRWLSFSWGKSHRLVVWLLIAGHKPLAHLPRWKRHLLHLPAVRWRLWPRPWNFNGPMHGYRRECQRVRDQRFAFWELIHDAAQELPTERRVHWLAMAEKVLR